jgi:elongation factor G
MGDVMGDLNTRRGRVLGMERVDGDSGNVRQRVNATVPQGELLTYAIDLRSLTHGRGSYIAEFSHYEEAPQHIEHEVIKEAVKNGFSIHVEH